MAELPKTPPPTQRVTCKAGNNEAVTMDAPDHGSRGDREPELLGQTVVVIGGSAGIGFETARRARLEGARVILTGRNPARLQRAATELGALNTAAFDAT